MNRREVLSTDTVVPQRRVEYWNDAACASLTPQVAEPLNPRTFSGRLVRADIGDLRFVEFSSDAAVVRRSRAHIARSGGAHFLVRFQLGSESVCSQGGEDVHLRAGDFSLCDTARPYQLAFNRPVSILTLRVAKTVLQRYVGSPESLVHVPVSGSTGAGALASRVIREIWKSSDEVALGPGVAPRCANVVLELIASAYLGVGRGKADRSCLASALRLRIMDFIDQALCDPDLSPTMVAQALKISSRHVHRLFAQQGGTVTRYILQRRLEKCRTALADPLLAGLSLTRICSEYGFRSLPHFSRLFHGEYGMAPRDYRREAATVDMSSWDKQEVADR